MGFSSGGYAMHRLLNDFEAACISYHNTPSLLYADVNGIIAQGMGSLGHLHLDNDGKRGCDFLKFFIEIICANSAEFDQNYNITLKFLFVKKKFT